MSEMVERVARAVQPIADPGGHWTTCEDIARAAIEAMREPTEGMIQAGWTTNGYRGDMTKAEWSAMIDAALAG